MTSASAGDPAGAEEGRGSPQTGTHRAAVRIAAALFLVLVFPILAVRLHFYLETPRYSHCVLLPVVSALWIWDRSDRLAAVPRAPSWRGFACLAAGALAFVYGRMVPNNMAQHLAMLVTLTGTVWALLGPAMLRALAFPLGYLVLMVPLKPWDEAVIQPLQRLAAVMAERFFEALGWVVVRQGNVLQLPRLKLLVEEGCSGVHSLFALLALGVAYVAFVERPFWLRLTLVAATVPITVFANAIRVSVTGVLAYKLDPSYAQGVSHQTAGMIVFGIGMALLLGLDWCLKPDVPAPQADART